MSLTSTTAFGHHSNMEQTFTDASLIQLIRLLATDPQQVITALETKTLSSEKALFKVGALLAIVSLLFATFAVLHQPVGSHWSTTELAIRFGFAFVAAGVLTLPMMVVICGLLQRFAAWYWDASLTLVNAVLLSGLSLGFYAGALLIGLVVTVLPLAAWAQQALLFILNIGAFGLLLRVFYTVYRAKGTISRKRAGFITLFPLFIVALTYSATQLLTYFAMVPHLRGGH